MIYHNNTPFFTNKYTRTIFFKKKTFQRRSPRVGKLPGYARKSKNSNRFCDFYRNRKKKQKKQCITLVYTSCNPRSIYYRAFSIDESQLFVETCYFLLLLFFFSQLFLIICTFFFFFFHHVGYGNCVLKLSGKHGQIQTRRVPEHVNLGIFNNLCSSNLICLSIVLLNK